MLLNASDSSAFETGDASPASPRSPPLSYDGEVGGSTATTWKYGPDNGALLGGGFTGERRVKKLSATSDFAVSLLVQLANDAHAQPIHQRVSRSAYSVQYLVKCKADRSRRHGSRSTQQGWTYHVIRWPLLVCLHIDTPPRSSSLQGFLFLIITLEFQAYVLTRQVVNLSEWLLAWRGHKATLRKDLREARTYDAWSKAARRLDAYLGFDEWKEVEEDSYFDYVLVSAAAAVDVRSLT